MKERVRRWDTVLWMLMKIMLYLMIMGTFVVCMGKDSHSLTGLSRTLGVTIITFIVVEMLFLSIYGKYDIGRRKSKPIITSIGLATFFTDIIAYIELMIMRTNQPSIYAFRLRSIGWLLLAFTMQVLIIAIFVYLGNELFFVINKPEKTCIVTSSQKKLDAVMRVISKYKKQYQPEEVFDYREKDLLQLIQDYHTVFVYEVPVKIRTEIIRYCYQEKKEIYYNPELHDIVEVNAEYYMLDDVSMLNARVKGLTMEQRIVKRLVDLVIALTAGIICLPFCLIAALAIKLDDGGPVFFKQKRATINGKVFDVIKFRTMKQNVDNHSVRKGDDRITKIGHLLRKTRVDEIPQLLNIIKGDMSFVGPRPEMLKNVVEYTQKLPEFNYRLRVKAGLTGYAQVAGKYNTTPKDKLVMDIMYIENYSILKDFQLIFQTFGVILKPDSTEAFDDKQSEEQLIFKPASKK